MLNTWQGEIKNFVWYPHVRSDSRCRLKGYHIKISYKLHFSDESNCRFSRGKDPTLVTSQDNIFCLSHKGTYIVRSVYNCK